jgi:hypothetical protein
LGWFRAISLPHVTHSENGCRGAYKHEFSPPEPFLRFSQRTCPIHYFRSKTNVWGGFAQFRCRTSPIPITGVGVHMKHEFLPTEPFLRFLQRTCQIHYFRSKTHVCGGFAQFHCLTSPISKMVVGVTRSTSFGHRNHFFVFCNEHAQSTTLGPKLMFGVVAQFRCRTSPILKTGVGVHTKHEFLPPELFLSFSQRTCPNHFFRSKTHVCVVSRSFVAARHPFRKRVSGCIQSMSFCHRNHFFVFRNEHDQTTNFRSQTHVWGGFAQFRCRTSPVPKTGAGVHTNHEFSPPEPFLHFSQRTCPIYYFRSKTHDWGGFAQFRCRTSPFLKWLSGASKAPVFATGTISSFFATNMPNSLI